MQKRQEACVGLTCTPGSEPPPDEYLEGALVTADSCTANLGRAAPHTHSNSSFSDDLLSHQPYRDFELYARPFLQLHMLDTLSTGGSQSCGAWVRQSSETLPAPGPPCVKHTCRSSPVCACAALAPGHNVSQQALRTQQATGSQHDCSCGLRLLATACCITLGEPLWQVVAPAGVCILRVCDGARGVCCCCAGVRTTAGWRCLQQVLLLVPYLAALDLVPVLLALLHDPQHQGVNLVGQFRLK